jgi:hypothetical protein
MSLSYRMTISEELAQLVEQRRGVLSLQEFTLLALLDRCNGSAVEHELWQQVRELQQLLGRVTAPPRERQASEALDERRAAGSDLDGTVLPTREVACDDRLGWG